MHERTTNYPRSKKNQDICSTAKAPDSQGMGADRQWNRGSPEASDSSPNLVSLAKGFGARGSRISKEQQAPSRPPHQRAGKREPKAQGNLEPTNPGIDAGKKRDEFGLTGRDMGSWYSQEQQQRIIQYAQSLCSKGFSLSEILKVLGVCRSTYYGWLKLSKTLGRSSSVFSLTADEHQAIVGIKKAQPQMSHRQISGSLRQDGYWISPSSCYRVLKPLGWVTPASFREAPWKVPRYEPFRPNQIWGEDWTILTIGGLRHYLLTVIDYFSRFIVAWKVVQTVTQHEVQELLTLAHIGEGIEHQSQKPLLRVDQGSPNIARGTKRLIKDLEMVLSPSRAYRPTDNGRQERWYRTAKQEEIYCYPTYPSLELARLSLARYIKFYNEQRPHQSLWNYTPGYLHRLGNKSELVSHYNQMLQIAKEHRRQINVAQSSGLRQCARN